MNSSILPAATIYGKFKEKFDKASEAAFENIQWSNFESEPKPEQILTYKLSEHLLLLSIINIVQRPRIVPIDQLPHPIFIWQVQAYIINVKTSHPLLERFWTRKQRMNLKGLVTGILYGVNSKTKPSFAIEKNIYHGYVTCTKEDMPVIEAAITEIQRKANEIEHIDKKAFDAETIGQFGISNNPRDRQE